MEEKKFYVADYPGSNDDEKIKACMAKASLEENPTVIFAGREFVISQAILVYSGMTVIVDDCTIRQADETFDNVFRGANIVLNSENPSLPAVSIEKMEGVRILGKGNAKIVGCEVNRRGYHSKLQEEQEMVGDLWGFLTYLILFVRTDQIEISGISISRLRSYGITMDFCTNVHIHDVHIESNVRNGDGIHFLSGCQHIVVEKITGTTSDDTVAVTSGFRADRTINTNKYMYGFSPAEGMGTDWEWENLDCYDIKIKDLQTGGRMHHIICLALNGTSVYNVEIENITDTCRIEPYPATVFLYTGIYGAPGTLHDIQVKNIDSLADTCLVVNTNVDNLLIGGLKSRTERKRLLGTFPMTVG